VATQHGVGGTPQRQRNPAWTGAPSEHDDTGPVLIRGVRDLYAGNPLQQLRPGILRAIGTCQLAHVYRDLGLNPNPAKGNGSMAGRAASDVRGVIRHQAPVGSEQPAVLHEAMLAMPS